jgi:NB-ARC domain
LIDVYTEVICFYARAIHFFRTHPHVFLRRGAWDEFRTDFSRTVRRIQRMSSTVESEADLSRMRTQEIKYREVLHLMEDLQRSKIQDPDPVKYYHVPSELNPRFWGREQTLKAIAEALDPEGSPGFLKTFALYGMGGVGKTQIALQYANQNRDRYSATLWIAADSPISMGQGFLSVARGLGLMSSDEEMRDAVTAILKVKSWLAESRESLAFTIKECPNTYLSRIETPLHSGTHLG